MSAGRSPSLGAVPHKVWAVQSVCTRGRPSRGQYRVCTPGGTGLTGSSVCVHQGAPVSQSVQGVYTRGRPSQGLSICCVSLTSTAGRAGLRLSPLCVSKPRHQEINNCGHTAAGRGAGFRSPCSLPLLLCVRLSRLGLWASLSADSHQVLGSVSRHSANLGSGTV